MKFQLTTLALVSALPLSLAAPASAPRNAAPAASPDYGNFNQGTQSSTSNDHGNLPKSPLGSGLPVPGDSEQTSHAVLNGLQASVKVAVNGVLGGLDAAVSAGNENGVLVSLGNIKPVTRPTSIDEAIKVQASIWESSSAQADFYVAVAAQVGSGLVVDASLDVALNARVSVGVDSTVNVNPLLSVSIFPKASSDDASYTLTEVALRAAIQIPSDFTFGVKPPVLFVPGTGSFGGSVFGNNLRKQLTGQDYADPVWLNIPVEVLVDAEAKSEFIAYAIHYISSISDNCQTISVISWAQGGLDTQRALTYWPSIRKLVKNFIPVSPDFGIPAISTNQVAVGVDVGLQVDGGVSALVPTTAFFSASVGAEVQLQAGSISADVAADVEVGPISVGTAAGLQIGSVSAGLSADVHAGPISAGLAADVNLGSVSAGLAASLSVGVSNINVQHECDGRVGGVFYGPSGLLFHPLTHALIVDVLVNGGPGDLARIDLDTVCGLSVSVGLELDDVVATIGLVAVAAVGAISY